MGSGRRANPTIGLVAAVSPARRHVPSCRNSKSSPTSQPPHPPPPASPQCRDFAFIRRDERGKQAGRLLIQLKPQLGAQQRHQPVGSLGAAWANVWAEGMSGRRKTWVARQRACGNAARQAMCAAMYGLKCLAWHGYIMHRQPGAAHQAGCQLLTWRCRKGRGTPAALHPLPRTAQHMSEFSLNSRSLLPLCGRLRAGKACDTACHK